VTIEEVPRVPRKRYQLEKALDKWLAIWADDPTLSEGDHERVQAERDRRKKLRKIKERTVGVVLSKAGAKPEQVHVLTEMLTQLRPSTILHPYAPPAVHRACTATGAEVRVTAYGARMMEGQLAATDADVVIGLATSFQMPDRKDGLDVWHALRRAKDRGIEVRVVWPDGSLLQGRW
jgi:hypothetical protein